MKLINSPDYTAEEQGEGTYWKGHAHYGVVKGVGMTFDGRFVVSCSEDGGLFCWCDFGVELGRVQGM